jgi:hypothetical protein
MLGMATAFIACAALPAYRSAAFGPATAGRRVAQGTTLRMVRHPRQTKDAADRGSAASLPVKG